MKTEDVVNKPKNPPIAWGDRTEIKISSHLRDDIAMHFNDAEIDDVDQDAFDLFVHRALRAALEPLLVLHALKDAAAFVKDQYETATKAGDPDTAAKAGSVHNDIVRLFEDGEKPIRFNLSDLGLAMPTPYELERRSTRACCGTKAATAHEPDCEKFVPPTGPREVEIDDPEWIARMRDPETEALCDLLQLVIDNADNVRIRALTADEREETARWAFATHVSASDNDDVIVPPKPAWLCSPSYRELAPGVFTIDGDIVGCRVRMRGGEHEEGVVKNESGGFVYLKLDGREALYICNRTSFTLVGEL